MYLWLGISFVTVGEYCLFIIIFLFETGGKPGYFNQYRDELDGPGMILTGARFFSSP
jgi:hypothetical protein